VPAFEYACPLRWSDMDAFGHVNNVQYLRYLEDARVAMFLEPPPDERAFTLDGDVVVARHEIDYLRPLVYRRAPVPLRVRVTKIGGASFTLAYTMGEQSTPYITASTVLAAFDQATGRARRLRPAERDWLGTYLEPSPV